MRRREQPGPALRHCLSLSPPLHPIHENVRIILPVSHPKSETATVAGAAGWVLPPELGGKQPLPRRQGTREQLGSAPLPSPGAGQGFGVFPMGFPLLLPCLPAPCLPRPPRSAELLGKSSQSWPGPCRVEEGWGGCREPGPSPLPMGLFWAGTGCAKAPREGKSQLHSLQAQQHLQKKTGARNGHKQEIPSSHGAGQGCR